MQVKYRGRTVPVMQDVIRGYDDALRKKNKRPKDLVWQSSPPPLYTAGARLKYGIMLSRRGCWWAQGSHSSGAQGEMDLFTLKWCAPLSKMAAPVLVARQREAEERWRRPSGKLESGGLISGKYWWGQREWWGFGDYGILRAAWQECTAPWLRAAVEKNSQASRSFCTTNVKRNAPVMRVKMTFSLLYFLSCAKTHCL